MKKEYSGTDHWFDDALLINRDPNWYGCVCRDLSTRESAERSVRSFFEIFTGYRITDVQLCVFENTSIIPSDKVMWRGDKYLQTEENGVPVSYLQLKGLYRLYKELKIDPVQIFLDVMRKGNIRPWITLRMNDAHFGDDRTSFLRDDFFYEAEKKGWMIGREYGYFAHCLDWGNEPVRERIIGLIREILEKYDIFGLELDFMREPFCFDYLHNDSRHGIMNDFIRTVHDMIKEAEERFGHPVRLMVRMPRDIENAYRFGFDVCLWANNKWIDAVVPTARWEVSDSGIPILEWKERMGEDIAVFSGLEILHLNSSKLTRDMAKAYSAAWNAQGADGLYFNNHDYASPEHREMYDLHRDTVLSGTRRFIVTYQDIAAKPLLCWHPLPMRVKGNCDLSLRVGPMREEDRISLIIEFEGDAPIVFWNGIRLSAPVKIVPIEQPEEETGKKECTIIKNTLKYDCAGMNTEGELTLTFNGEGILRYVEIRAE